MTGTIVRPTRSRAAGRTFIARCTGLLLLSGLLSAGALPDIGHAQAAPTTVRSSAVTVADRYAAYVVEASHRFGIPVRWIEAVLNAESSGLIHAVSPKGAMGLMQLMPASWAELRARYHLGSDPFDARDNILAGTAYLRELHDRYGAPGFLAAYNAGPGRYDDYLATDRALPPETRAFVAALAPFVTGDRADPIPRGSLPGGDPGTRAPLFVGPFPGGAAATPSPSGRRSIDASVARDGQSLSVIPPLDSGLFVAPLGMRTQP